MAVADSGLEITDENRYDVGVIYGSGGGGQGLFISNQEIWQTKGARSVSPFFIANGLVDASSGTIAIETGAKGHNFCPVSACSTGTTAIGEAAEAIRRGDCTAVIAGAAESPLLELVHIGFTNMRGMGTPLPGQPIGTVCRPFDRTRDGFVLGEGAGALILEDLELAKARGARIYAEVVGYGSAADGFDMIAPADGGEGSARAMKMRPGAARRAGRRDRHDQPARHLHAGRRQARERGDLGGLRQSHAQHPDLGHEVDDRPHDGRRRGLRGRGDGRCPSTTRPCPGRSTTASPIRSATSTIATETIEKPIRYALSNNIGLGGHNAAVIFKRYTGD